MADFQSPLLALEVVLEDDISPELDAAIRRLLCECFPSDKEAFSVRRAWNEVRPAFSVIGRQGEKLAGQVGIIERTITCGGEPVCVAGIQSLAVALDWRRTGLSQRLMTTATDETRRRGICFGLLFCVPKLEGFYSRMGWQRIDRRVTMCDADGRSVPLTAKNITMELALIGERLPSGLIDLQGRDW